MSQECSGYALRYLVVSVPEFGLTATLAKSGPIIWIYLKYPLSFYVLNISVASTIKSFTLTFFLSTRECLALDSKLIKGPYKRQWYNASKSGGGWGKSCFMWGFYLFIFVYQQAELVQLQGWKRCCHQMWNGKAVKKQKPMWKKNQSKCYMDFTD